MSRAEPDFTIGIEEEYLLVDREGLALARAPGAIIKPAPRHLKGNSAPSF